MISYKLEHVSDSFEKLECLPDKSVDVFLADPPYSAHCQANMCSGSLVGKKSVPKRELSFAPMESFHWLHDAMRVTRRWVVVFCTVESFGLIEQLVGHPAYVRGCIWYRPNAMGQLTRDRPATAYEGIVLLHPEKPKKRWNGKGSYGIYKCNSTRGKKDRHPNEKPVDLCMKLVSLFSERGETILDPFCGSSAIGEAALRLGRNYEGWDNDLAWVEKSKVRLAGCQEDTTDEHAISLCRMNT